MCSTLVIIKWHLFLISLNLFCKNKPWINRIMRYVSSIIVIHYIPSGGCISQRSINKIVLFYSFICLPFAFLHKTIRISVCMKRAKKIWSVQTKPDQTPRKFSFYSLSNYFFYFFLVEIDQLCTDNCKLN